VVEGRGILFFILRLHARRRFNQNTVKFPEFYAVFVVKKNKSGWGEKLGWAGVENLGIVLL
jgi:hypothetical protein